MSIPKFVDNICRIYFNGAKKMGNFSPNSESDASQLCRNKWQRLKHIKQTGTFRIIDIKYARAHSMPIRYSRYHIS